MTKVVLQQSIVAKTRRMHLRAILLSVIFQTAMIPSKYIPPVKVTVDILSLSLSLSLPHPLSLTRCYFL